MRVGKVMLQDGHRLFIQSFLERPILGERDARTLYLSCTESDSFQRSDFQAFLGEINDKLNLYDLSIRQSNCHVTGEPKFVLANLAEDRVSARFGSSLKGEEMQVFREIVAQISQTKNYRISSLSLLNSDSVARLAGERQKAEQLVERFVEKHWLARDEKGKICIGVRSAVELAVWLRDEFEFPVCTLCKEIATSGSNCDAENCGATTHVHCLAKLAGPNGTKTCVDCAGSKGKSSGV